MSFIRRHSGDRTKPIIAVYTCPVHGEFDAEVQRDENGEAPDSVVCGHRDTEMLRAAIALSVAAGTVDDYDVALCNEVACWTPSPTVSCRVRRIEAASKGKWQKPEHKTWTDTSAIAEGQPLYEWKEDRAKVWEEKRRQDVVDFAREHNERVIGGD